MNLEDLANLTSIDTEELPIQYESDASTLESDGDEGITVTEFLELVNDQIGEIATEVEEKLVPPPAYQEQLEVPQELGLVNDQIGEIATEVEEKLVPPPVYQEQLEAPQENLEQTSLEALAQFNFEEASQSESNPEQLIDSIADDSSEMMQVTIKKRQWHKNPYAQLAAAGFLGLVLFSIVGQLIGGATSVASSEDTESAVEQTQSKEDQEDNLSSELAQTKASLASDNLSREVENANKAIDAKKNSVTQTKASAKSSNSSNLPVDSNRVTRIPPTPTRTNTYTPASNRIPFPSRSNIPAVKPKTSEAPPPQAVTKIPKTLPSINGARNVRQTSIPQKVTQERPTMLAMGNLPSDQPSNSEFKGESAPLNQENVALSQELKAFMGDASTKKISGGDKFSGTTTTNAIAISDTQFLIQLTGGFLDGAIVIGKVGGTSGSNLMASAETLIFQDIEYELENVQITGQGGKTLKARKNKGFFQSSLGKAFLSAGSGLARQATSRSESFTQFSNGGFSQSRSGGAKDFETLVFGALNGFTDPLLDVPDPENTAFLKVGSAVELHFYKGLVVYE